jgi:hypothetical protein
VIGEFLLIGWLMVGAERLPLQAYYATQLECEAEGRKLDVIVTLLTGIDKYARVYWGCERKAKT